MNTETMTEIFRNVGKEYGYETVTTDFVGFTQFKVQWQRSYNWISFRISDYMKDAPNEVVEGLAKSLFEKIGGKAGEYSDCVREWVLAPQFSQKHRPKFIKRTRGIIEDDTGELWGCLERLVARGLIPADHNIEVMWKKDSKTELAATYSVLMRTIMVNDKLKDENTIRSVLEYVIYNNYVKIDAGARTFGTSDTPEFEDDLAKFEDFDRMEELLEQEYSLWL